MKYLFLVGLLIPLISSGQKSFAPLHTIWNYEGHEIDCLGNHIQYKAEKEIFLANKDCSVIYAYHSDDLDPEFRFTGDTLVVWENENKVYFLEDTTFYLLFDFTVDVGDTLIYYDPINRGLFSSTINNNNAEPNKLKTAISDISSIDISGEMRKVFKTDYIPGDTPCTDLYSVIENIGSLAQGFTGDFCFHVGTGCLGGLQCYSNGDLKYINPISFQTPNPGCDDMDGSKEITELSDILVYPNPADDFVIIQGVKGEVLMGLYDINSRLLFKQNNSDLIQMNDLKNGVYILKISLGDYFKYFKLIKQ